MIKKLYSVPPYVVRKHSFVSARGTRLTFVFLTFSVLAQGGVVEMHMHTKSSKRFPKRGACCFPLQFRGMGFSLFSSGVQPATWCSLE